MDNKISVLYIGDSPETAEIVQHFQSSQDIELTAFSDALAADNFMNKNAKPDVIFCEYDILGGPSIDYHERIRSNKEFDGVAFIVLAHEFKEEHFFEALTNRIDDFYVLPLPPAEDLMKRISFLKEYREKSQQVSQPQIVDDGSEKHQTYERKKIPTSKRFFDIAVAGAALFVLFIPLLLIVIAIKLESRGKYYYISKRRGRYNVPFDFYKLRSMKTGSDADLKKLATTNNQYTSATQRSKVDYSAPCPLCVERNDGKPCAGWVFHDGKPYCEQWIKKQKKEIAIFKKISKDPRVTRVGKFIRNTSIDELPQLINVIKGDMSIVGNRPLPEDEAELLTGDGLAKRFYAPAGLTGLWQVELRGRGGVMSQKERLDLDNTYADFFINDTYSFRYDLRLIIRTFKALFQKDSV